MPLVNRYLHSRSSPWEKTPGHMWWSLVGMWLVGVARAQRIGVLPAWNSVVVAATGKNQSNSSDRLVVIDTTSPRTAFEKIEKTNKTILDLKLHAVIGNYDPEVSLATESLGIPYVCTTDADRKKKYNFLVQVRPEVQLASQALLDIAQSFAWSKISVFYDDAIGVQVLETLMTNHSISVRAWRLAVKARRQQVKDALVEMRKVLVDKSVVLCSKENVRLLLDEARSLAMLSSPPYGWMFYDPGDDLRTLFTSYQDITCNFTVLTLLPYNSTSLRTKGHPRLDFALAKDALHLVMTSYTVLVRSAMHVNIALTDWLVRASIDRGILNNMERGLTGILEFNSQGRRSNVTYAITTVTGDDSYPRGHWSSQENDQDRKLVLYQERVPSNRSSVFPLRGRTAKVVMIEEKPFTMMKKDHHRRQGNDRFQGFAVDLIAEIARILDFDYEIYLVHDGKFGNKMANGEWNGMIGELLSGNATMSVAPLSVNAEREDVIDFTKPFKTRFISVLMLIPKRDNSYFEFLNPLSPEVWACTLAAFVLVSLVLYGLERVGQGSNFNSQITVRESFWFIFGSLLQGNTDATPSSTPGRILTSAWWFFALILISSYTANLAAFLTVQKINTPIKSVTDLAQQNRIKYGTVKDSGVMNFFKYTNIEHFAKMWSQMSEIDPDSMVDNTTEGYRKVKEGNYAFFWDTTVNRYQTIIDCDVMEVGPAFDPKGFGIGVPPGATYSERLSMAILELSDQGRLHEIETKWWDANTCPEVIKTSSDETSSLHIDNVAGVFFILIGGILIAAIVCVGEYFGHTWIQANKLAAGTKVTDTSCNSYRPSNHVPNNKDTLT